MKRRALFLDRDGVINKERGIHTWKVEDTILLPDVAQALRKAQDAGYALVVITNQSGIGLDLYGHEDVAKVHAYLEAELAAAGVHLTDILYCPHHPQQGRCLCRKPGSLLIERAIAKHDLELEGSAMVGDKERDVQAAETAGVRGILVPANGELLPIVLNVVPRG
ncbi:MAG: HAD family hydrolase [Flavobacteriales bacterium]|nr:HAD family hydrolase [Flavobacteriales bacterium]